MSLHFIVGVGLISVSVTLLSLRSRVQKLEAQLRHLSEKGTGQ